MTMTLRAARVNAGLTQVEAAKSIGINVNKLSNWQKGIDLENMTWGQRTKIEDLYNMPGDCILWLKNIGNNE